MPPAAPAVGRNDPCPCGNGLRYKQCHGALPATAAPTASLHPEGLARQGFDAHRNNDLDAAERHYRAALALAPDHAGALHYLGVVLYQRNRLAEALPLLDRAVALSPDEPEFHNNRGLALVAARRAEEAITEYRRALALRPAHHTAWNNLGLALQESGDVDGAVEAFYSGLRIAPDFTQLHWNLSLALLLQGDFARGWPEYEWRLKAPELRAHHPVFAGPRWSGDDPAGRTLLLTWEQGNGDTLQNLRFARQVADRGARVIVAVQEPLRRLAATATGVSAAYGPNDPLPPYDAHISLMSLPGVLGVTPETLSVPVPYLRPDEQRLREAVAAVRSHGRPTLNVGVAWSGSPGNTSNFKRSMTLVTLGALLDVPGTRWFSLKWQAEVLTPEDAPFAQRLVALPMRNDFDGLAALVSELDLVITVDTSIAHLAGALGKPLWVMLSRVPDWRWLLGRTDSPWYPTARLFRQNAVGDWTQPLRDADAALRLLVAKR
ncbi:MAG: tetratricopeptide repeat protein [Casimicrobiaceae bacterium]